MTRVRRSRRCSNTCKPQAATWSASKNTGQTSTKYLSSLCSRMQKLVAREREMPMGRLVKRFFRSAAFIGKEFNEVRRQPRLILALILGPFLILLLFGIGYVGENEKLSAIIVVPRGEDFTHDPAEYARLTGDQLIIRSVTDDEGAALNELQNQKVDLVVVVPSNVGEQISSGAQVALSVYLNEIDPVRRQSVSYLTYFYAHEIN